MFKILITLGAGVLFTLSACAGAGDQHGANDNIFKKSTEPSRVSNPNQNYNVDNHNNGNKSKDFGFVRHNRIVIDGETVGSKDTASLDREQLADIITRLAVQIPGIDEAATLVTDEEALIAYRTSKEDRNEAADQVKRTGMSVLPRFFHVYVTDNPALMQDVENYANLDTHTKNIDHMLDQTIKQMKKSPQGKSISSEENANGETKNDMTKGR